MIRRAILCAVALAACSRTTQPEAPSSATGEPTTTAAASEAPQMTQPMTAQMTGTPKTGVAPFALVELFTSEGCSSCPPADALLAELDAHARATDAKIYPLSFHVDYWNGLGWSDPFSDASYSDRQGAYAHALGGGTFTPNMIVNGADSFVGSDEAHAARAIETALASRPASAIAIDADLRGDTVNVHFRTTGAPSDAKIVVALVQASATSIATRGENSGRTLHHVDVVRALTSVAVAADGETRVAVPSALARDGAAVVAWVQEPSTMRVVAAARAPLTAVARPRS
jgi:hypothetical protein